MPLTRNDGVFTDTGTGAYSGPSSPETFGDPDAPVTDLGTGAYPGPTEPEVYVSEDNEGAPTGAFPGPDGPETRTEWPAGTEAVDVTPAAETEAAPAKATRKASRARKR